MLATTWLWRGGWLALGVLLLSGCRQKLEEVEKPYREKLEARLAEVERIGQTLARLPLLERDDETVAISPGGGAYGMLAGHVAFMYQEAFADLTEQAPALHLRLAGANPFNDCASLLRKRRCPSGSSGCGCDHEVVTILYRRCLSVRYLVVVRTLEYGEPEALVRTTPDLGVPDLGKPREAGSDYAAKAAELNRQLAELQARHRKNRAAAPASSPAVDGGAPAEAVDAGARDLPRPDRGRDLRVESFQYRAGVFRAEVHVFEVAGAKRLGGFRVEARDPASSSSSYAIGSRVAEPSGFLLSNFRLRCQNEITSQVKARVSGAFVRPR